MLGWRSYRRDTVLAASERDIRLVYFSVSWMCRDEVGHGDCPTGERPRAKAGKIPQVLVLGVFFQGDMTSINTFVLGTWYE